MSLKQKIYLFSVLLILNHILHTYEVYITGYRKEISLFISNPTLFILIQILIFLFLLFLCFQLYTNKKWIFPFIRIIAFLFLFYGILLAFGNIYREEKVIGSYTGFIHVMICLPLVLWISDYLKKEKNSEEN